MGREFSCAGAQSNFKVTIPAPCPMPHSPSAGWDPADIALKNWIPTFAGNPPNFQTIETPMSRLVPGKNEIPRTSRGMTHSLRARGALPLHAFIPFTQRGQPVHLGAMVEGFLTGGNILGLAPDFQG